MDTGRTSSQALNGSAPSYRQYRAAALLFFLFVCGTNTATPLYPLWQKEMVASNAMVTAVFSIYPIGVIAGLLFGGRVADQIGRRPVIAVALVLGSAAMFFFILATRIEHLLLGRALYGVAMGLISGPAASTLIELHPTGDKRRGSWQAAITTLVAPGFGLVTTAIFIRLAPTLQTAVAIAFSCQLVALLACGLLLRIVPESFPGTRRLTWREAAYTPQRAAVPRDNLKGFVLACAISALSWCGTSTWLGLGPSFVLNILHVESKLSGLLVLIPLAAGGIVQLSCQGMGTRRAIHIGLLLLAAGFLSVALALQFGSMTAFLAGSLIAGAAVGFAWMGAAEFLNRIAPPEHRASVFSLLYIVGYLSSSLPIWGTGMVSDRIGFLGGATILTLGLSAVAALVLIWDLVDGPPDPVSR